MTTKLGKPLKPNARIVLRSGSNATGRNLATLRKCAHPLGRITAAIGANKNEFDIAASLKIGANKLQFRQLCNTWRTLGGEKIEHKNFAGCRVDRHRTLADWLQSEWRRRAIAHVR